MVTLETLFFWVEADPTRGIIRRDLWRGWR